MDPNNNGAPAPRGRGRGRGAAGGNGGYQRGGAGNGGQRGRGGGVDNQQRGRGGDNGQQRGRGGDNQQRGRGGGQFIGTELNNNRTAAAPSRGGCFSRDPLGGAGPRKMMALGTAVHELATALGVVQRQGKLDENTCKKARWAIDALNGTDIESCPPGLITGALDFLAAVVSPQYADTLSTMPQSLHHDMKVLLRIACTDKGQLCKAAALMSYLQHPDGLVKLATILSKVAQYHDQDIFLHVPGGVVGVQRVRQFLSMIPDVVNSYADLVAALDTVVTEANNRPQQPQQRGRAPLTTMPITFRTHPIKPRPRDLINPPPPIVPIVLDKPLVSLEAHFNSLFQGYWYDFMKPLYQAILDSNYVLTSGGGGGGGRNKKGGNNPIYRDLFINGFETTVKGVGVHFSFKSKRLLGKKQLKAGSLVVLSTDSFNQNFLFGTVGSVESTGKKGDAISVAVNFFDPRLSFEHLLSPLTLVESPSFYEEAQHILRAIQNFSFDTLTFPKTLMAEPDMLDEHSCELAAEFDEGTALEGLDPSQETAMRLILKSRFPIIQGPPGTGKTYIGVRAVIAALDTSLARNTPILILCYTNHALDSFLKDIIKMGHPALNEQGKVVRLGRSSKDPEMELLTLQRRTQYTSQFNKARAEVLQHCRNFSTYHPPELEEYRSELQREWEDLRSRFDDLSTSYEIAEAEYESLKEKRGPAAEAALKRKDDQLNEMYYELNELKDRKATRKPEDYMQIWVGDVNERNTDLGEGEGDDFVDTDNVRRLEASDDIQRHSFEVGQFFAYYERYKTRIEGGHLTFENEQTSHQRAALLYHCIHQHRQICLDEMSGRVVDFNSESESLDMRTWEACLPQLQNARIIAATTTGMSKLGFIVAKTNPQLVVLEEAAEIAEPHALAALFPTCKKVIQIGDHQQLRPKVNEYDSAVRHHMDVSLMERMIRSGHIEYATLCTQRRMRPEIVQYTSGLYSERLAAFGGVYTHEVALQRHPLTSLDSTVVFLNHTMPEQVDEVSQSKSNPGEAKFSVQLAEYLSKQMESDGLDSSCVTILTPYSGQVRQLRKLLSEIKLDVRVASIDDFQGEENDVIILSLVRSEEVGFLKTDNRICVALSRARRGMVVIGNLEVFEKAKASDSKPTYWASVIDLARTSKHLMNDLPLKCPRHGTITRVKVNESIRLVSPQGGCDKPCGMRRECGHACERNCHMDPCESVPCNRPCGKSCDYGHRCTLKCSQPCRCMEEVEKTFQCQHAHKVRVKCYVEPTAANCTKETSRKFDHCSHSVKAACGSKNLPMCKEKCGMALRGCKHPCSNLCGKCKGGRFNHPPCEKKCGRAMLCGHVCAEKCATICRPCESECLSECPHAKCPKSCGQPCTPCAELCRANMECTHGERRCRQLCGEPCNVAPCTKRCEKKNPDCGHQCQGICGETCPLVCFECEEFDLDKHDPLFLMADEESLFIKLNPCGHEFPVESLDGWVRSRIETNLPYIDCPQCKCRITHSYRYQSTLFEGLTANLFTSAQRWKREKLGEAEKLRQAAINERHRLLVVHSQIKDVKCHFTDAIAAFLAETKQLDDPPPKNKKEREAYKVVPTWCQRVAKASLQLQLLRLSVGSTITILPACNELNDLVRVPSTDCAEELRRMVQVRCLETQNIGVEMRMAFLEGQDGEDYLSEKLLKLVAPPSMEEMRTIHAALAETSQIQAGAWNRCVCGYIYAIGDCGGAVMVATCPECKRNIGGANHANLNAHVGDFDGSTAHAWPQHAPQ